MLKSLPKQREKSKLEEIETMRREENFQNTNKLSSLIMPQNDIGSYYSHERRTGCSFFEIGNKNEILGIKNQKSMEELRSLQERRGKK